MPSVVAVAPGLWLRKPIMRAIYEASRISQKPANVCTKLHLSTESGIESKRLSRDDLQFD
jgi:hypothetical protein